MTALWCLTCHTENTCTFDMLPDHDVLPSETWAAQWDKIATDIRSSNIGPSIKDQLLGEMDRTRDRMHSLRDGTLRKLGFIP